MVECSQQTQHEHKIRHEIAAIIHWEIHKKFDFMSIESDKAKTLWNFSIQTEKKVEHNKPDIVVVGKEERYVTLWILLALLT